MKKTSALIGAFLAFSVSPAFSAAGTRISWDDCPGTKNVTSTCASNLESNKRLQGTFELSAPTTIVGNEIQLDAWDTTGAPLTCWWNMVSSNPHRASGWDMLFTDPGNCFDYWASIPGGPMGGASATASGNRIRFVGVVAVSEAQAQPVPDGVPIYSFTWRLKFGNTTGGTCPGCTTPMLLYLQRINVTQPTGSGPDIGLGPDPVDPHPCALFQYAEIFCFGAVAAKNSTWGEVKALYR